MGRLAIILVIILVASVGIISYSINLSKKYTVENVSGFHKYTIGRNIAHTGVNMMLRKLDKNDTSIINPMNRGQKVWMRTNVMAGICSVSIQLKNPLYLDTVDLTSKSQFMDTVYTMRLRLQRSPIPFPSINEAVGLNVPNVEFKIKGASVRIDGRDHDVNGVLTSGVNDKPGVGIVTPADSIKVLDPKWVNQILGTRKVVVDDSMLDPSQYLTEYLMGADITYRGPTTIPPGVTWGSSTTPWIVVCDASAGEIKFPGKIEGWGILVLRGGMEMETSFKFHGLVIVYDSLRVKDIEFDLEGSAFVVGGLLMAGGGGSFELEENSKVYYSKEALDLARYINKLQAYKVMKWYE